MTLIAAFHFLRPLWLLLVPVVILVWWFASRTRDPLRGWRRVIDGSLLDALTIGRQAAERWSRVTLLMGWLLAVIAVAGPVWRVQPSPLADDPVPVMVVLKAGESMKQSDLSPTRMERAQLKVTDLANERKGKPLGLIAYAGTPHLVLPPTRDTSVVATMAEQISPEIMPKPGDDLVAALKLADRTLGEGGGSIIVVADTVDGANDAALAEFRAESRARVLMLAVAREGTPEAAAIERTAAELKADVEMLTPDATDVDALVAAAARTPIALRDAGEETRWVEDGWWLVPLLCLLSLATFRRSGNPVAKEALA